MKRTEVYHGMKVVPHSKTSDGRTKGLEKSSVWKKAKQRNQLFLYITRVRFYRNGNGYPEVLLDVDRNTNSGDYFHIDDFNKYQKPSAL